VISTVSHRPEAIAAAAWRTWIINEQPDLRHVRNNADAGGLGGADNRDASYAIDSFYVALGST